ncbi:hypothetical protein [Gordonia sputi]|uniref:hypothetical protein n=1 Tax=Gordonia sputi TaxID=36823 RepID=UPI00368E8EBB
MAVKDMAKEKLAVMKVERARKNLEVQKKAFEQVIQQTPVIEEEEAEPQTEDQGVQERSEEELFRGFEQEFSDSTMADIHADMADKGILKDDGFKYPHEHQHLSDELKAMNERLRGEAYGKKE